MHVNRNGEVAFTNRKHEKQARVCRCRSGTNDYDNFQERASRLTCASHMNLFMPLN